MDDLLQHYHGAKFLFLAKGVLMYFKEDQVKDFFQNIAARFHGSKISLDTLTKWMSKKTGQHDTVSKTGASFQSVHIFRIFINSGTLAVALASLVSHNRHFKRFSFVWSALLCAVNFIRFLPVIFNIVMIRKMDGTLTHTIHLLEKLKNIGRKTN